MDKLEFDTQDKKNIRWQGYSLALVNFLRDTCSLPGTEDDKNTLVYFATPNTAFAKYILPMINGKTIRPVITVAPPTEEISDMITSPYVYYNVKGDTNRKSYKFNYPIIKELTYNCLLFSVTMEQADLMLMKLEASSNKYKPYCVRIGNRTAEYYVDGITFDSNINTGSGETKVIQYSFTVKVPRAVIFTAEENTNTAIVKDINVVVGDDKMSRSF